MPTALLFYFWQKKTLGPRIRKKIHDPKTQPPIISNPPDIELSSEFENRER